VGIWWVSSSACFLQKRCSATNVFLKLTSWNQLIAHQVPD